MDYQPDYSVVFILPESGVGELVEPMVWFYQQSTLLSQGKVQPVHCSRFWLCGTVRENLFCIKILSLLVHKNIKFGFIKMANKVVNIWIHEFVDQ